VRRSSRPPAARPAAPPFVRVVLALACLGGPAAWAQEAPEGAARTTPKDEPRAADQPARTDVVPAAEGGAGFPLILGTLPSGKSLTIVFRTTVNTPFMGDSGQVSNQGTVSGSNFPNLVTNDPDTPAADDPTVTPIDLHPDLSLAKSDGGASATPGGTVTYALTYSNLSSFGAPGVVLSDVVPALTTFNPGASSPGWACLPNNNAGSTCTLSVGLVSGLSGGSRNFAVTVNATVPAGASQISNTASVASSLTDPVAGNNSASDTTPLVAQPDFSITKSDGGATGTPGGGVAYTLSYQNAGNQGATGVVLTDVVPANTTFNPAGSTAGWACTPNNNAGSSCTLAVGALSGGGASGSATYAVTIVSPLPAGVAQISNTGTIADDGANGADPTPANNTSTDTTPVTAAPDLQIAKSDGGATATPGGGVTYTLSYQNSGNQGATGVVLTDVVPANTTFNPAGSTAGWACTPNNNAGSSCTLAVGALNGGASGSAAYAVTVVNPVPAGVAQISNTGSVADDGANGADPTPANNSATDTTPVNAAPDLAIVKDDGGVSTTPGGTVTYTLAFSNVGNQGATGVVLTDVVPANTTFNPGASSAGWACAPDNNAGSTCTLAVGAVAGGGSGSRNYAVTVADPVPGGVTQVSNTASVADDGANGTDPNTANNTESETTPIVAAPDMTITKSDAGVQVAPGGTVTYSLSFTNAGNRGATGVVLTDVVPANTTFDPFASSAGWVCTPNNNAGSSCVLTVGTVAAGGNGSRNYAVTVVSPAPAGLDQVSNTATIADDGANGADPNTLNNTSTDTTPVNAAPDVSITKSDGGASAAPGGTIAYALGFSNVGNQGATGVVLTETVPANTTFNAGASTAGWSCVPDNNPGSVCSLAVGALISGGSGSATFAVTVVSPAPAGLAQVSNTASVADDGTNGADPNPGNNSASDTTPVDAAPDLTIAKSDGGASAPLGASIAYALSYSNAGNQGATGVTLTETVPANTTFDAASSTAGWTCVPDTNPGSVCTLAVGALAGGGAAGSATFAVTVAATVPGGVTEISNTASIADDGTNGADPNPADNTASDQTPLVLVPDITTVELTHGFRVVESLAALPGPQADTDRFVISQKPFSSYEVVVDATAGGVNDVVLERIGPDGTTVMQVSEPIGVGSGRSLRFSNDTAAPVDGQFVRVRSGQCATDCGAASQYRLRAYETTYTLERLNNAGPNITVVILQNRGSQTANGVLYLWDTTGTQVGSQAFTIAPFQMFVFNTATIAPGVHGGMTITSNAPYGTLAGKAAVLDPVSGPAQDVIMRPRVR
jgi:uncharacterized repeat protein (TIGR01451 family)